MDAALLLVALVFAGQAGWTPERSAAPPPASAPVYDRYAQPPSTGISGVAPPPSVADRFQAQAEAANEQFQSWTDSATRQLQSTGENLRTAAQQALRGDSGPSRASNPFAATTSQAPAASARTRGGAAPPPWNSSGTSAPDWDADSEDSTFGQPAPPALQPIRTDSGWTSIGSQVAAPPLLIPSLTTKPSTTQSGAAITRSDSSSAPLGRGVTPPTNGADSWATGWDNNAGGGQATISRSTDAVARTTAGGNDLGRGETGNSRSQDTQANSSNNWADLWGDNDPWADSPQGPAPATSTPQAPAITSPPAVTNSAGPPLLAAPANNFGNAAAAPPVIGQPALGAPTLRGEASTSVPVGDEPPWMPLLVVSLSLAGSLGANLFLGWSYLDARQRYSTLVRKTADKFRRAATATA
jgi:hypothetical protein